jgi:hypothetical protein
MDKPFRAEVRGGQIRFSAPAVDDKECRARLTMIFFFNLAGRPGTSGMAEAKICEFPN